MIPDDEAVVYPPCPQCHGGHGMPSKVFATEGRTVVTVTCKTCGHAWMVERVTADLFRRRNPSQ